MARQPTSRPTPAATWTPPSARITAAATLVAFTGDLFFPPEDIKADADRDPRREVPSRPAPCWGHFTMFNLREQDTAAIDAIYAEALTN